MRNLRRRQIPRTVWAQRASDGKTLYVGRLKPPVKGLKAKERRVRLLIRIWALYEGWWQRTVVDSEQESCVLCCVCASAQCVSAGTRVKVGVVVRLALALALALASLSDPVKSPHLPLCPFYTPMTLPEFTLEHWL